MDFPSFDPSFTAKSIMFNDGFFEFDGEEEDHVADFCQSNYTPFHLRSKRSIVADHENDLVNNAATTLCIYAAAVYLGFYFAFVIWIFVHQFTVRSTDFEFDICAAPSFLNTIYTLIGLCPPYQTPTPNERDPHIHDVEDSAFSKLLGFFRWLDYSFLM